jgi:phosphoglycerate dehydrogenase-like enzyme
VLKIVVLGPHMGEWLPFFRALLATPAEVGWVGTYEPEAVAEAVAEADVVVTGVLTPPMTSRCRRLRLVHMPGAGYDKIDRAAIPDGAVFANCYEHEHAIAEWTLMVCLALARKLLAADAQLRQGDWSLYPGSGAPVFPELRGQTMGLIGLGRVGRATARLAAAFGMRCVGVDVHESARQAAAAFGLERVGGREEMDQLLAESDVVVVAVPLDESTRGLLGARELGLMKPTAFLVNPARGPIVDERALYEALAGQRIAGAGLDAWYCYPVGQERLNPSRYPIHTLPNVVITPHTSGWTRQTMESRWRIVAANVDRLARGEPLVGLVPELSKADGALSRSRAARTISC